MMVADQIEKLKREYTDKWVAVVDENAPELSRYHDRFGQVKTVNMNGRALVEFHGGVDVGWIDIDLDYLKVVEKPDFAAMEAEKKAAAKAAPKAKAPAKKPAPKGPAGEKLSPLEMARQMGAKKKGADKPTGGGKPSTADILAAARGKGSAETPAEKSDKPKSGGKLSTADILAAARANKEAAAPASAAKVDAGAAPKAAPTDTAKLSTADILAAARGKGEGAAPAKKPAPAKPASEEAEDDTVFEKAAEPTIDPEPAEQQAAEAAEKHGADLPKDVPGMLAYCRKVDAN